MAIIETMTVVVLVGVVAAVLVGVSRAGKPRRRTRDSWGSGAWAGSDGGGAGIDWGGGGFDGGGGGGGGGGGDGGGC